MLVIHNTNVNPYISSMVSFTSACGVAGVLMWSTETRSGYLLGHDKILGTGLQMDYKNTWDASAKIM
jgi:hypothetical protein